MLRATRILCPVDFSEPSAYALRQAIGLAAAWQAPLHVLTVLDDPTRHLHGGPLDAGDFRQAEEAVHRFVQDQLPPVAAWHPELQVSVRVGSAGEEIVRTLRDVPAGLLVIGTRGRTGVRKWLFGSTCERLLRLPPCRILAVSGPEHPLAPLAPQCPVLQIRKVLVATDFGPDSLLAVRDAAELAAGYGAELLVSHVVARPLVYAVPGEAPLVIGTNQDLIDEAERELAECLAQVGARGPVTRLLLEGTAYLEIAYAAQQHEADLIVMGSTGRGGVHHSLTGLTTYGVVSHARCPVMVLPAERQIEAAFETVTPVPAAI